MIADPPSRWAALGFAVGEDGGCDVGAIRLQLGAGGEDGGITGWALRDVRGGAIDGLRTVGSGAPRRAPAPPQPNGVIGVDHVVVATPDFARTTAALETAGFDLRRVRAVGQHSVKQAFYVVGDAVLEVVGPTEPKEEGPATFWGLALVAADLDATCAALGEFAGEPDDAVQPGRQIMKVRTRAAGLRTRIAVMSPR